MKMRLMVVLILTMAAILSTLAFGAGVTYYVDSVNGNDANNGTSSSTPWRTLARVEQQTFGAGDQILLKRGCAWQEPAFQPTGSGAAGAPIVLADYGSGALPKIIGNADRAVYLLNVSYWTIRNLEITQVGLAPLPLNDEQKNDGVDGEEFGYPILHIRALNNGATNHIRVENCVIHDGHWNGIWISAGMFDAAKNNVGTIDDVVVTNCEVYNVHKNGLEATCTFTNAPTWTCSNIQILNSSFHDCGGDGAVVGPIQTGLIDHCVAYGCGWERNARVGLWDWESNDVTIQFCESYNNMAPFYTNQTRDGSGFDLDLGSIDCVVQYCYSHHNTGEGYLLMTWPEGQGRGVSSRQTMRYCISEHDATKNGGSILSWGGNTDTWIYNNVIYYIPERSAGSVMSEGEGGALCMGKWGKSGIPITYSYNNIYVCDKTKSQNQSAVSYLIRKSAGTLYSNNNCYYRVEGGVLFKDGQADVSTWSGWQAKGYDANGMNANPLFAGAWDGGAAAYQLTSGSPCINAGRIVSESPLGMGSIDYFGNTVPYNGAFDIGANEYQGGAPPSPSPSPSAPPPSPSPSPSTPPSSPSPSPSPSPSSSPVPNTMHVADIWTTDASGNPKTAYVGGETVYTKIKIVDAYNAVVSGASVTMEIWRPGDTSPWQTLSGTTGADGIVTISKALPRNPLVGTWTNKVTNVTKAGWTYNAAANVKSQCTYTVS